MLIKIRRTIPPEFGEGASWNMKQCGSENQQKVRMWPYHILVANILQVGDGKFLIRFSCLFAKQIYFISRISQRTEMKLTCK